MDGNFVKSIEMSHDRGAIYHGSFYATKFLSELKKYNQLHDYPDYQLKYIDRTGQLITTVNCAQINPDFEFEFTYNQNHEDEVELTLQENGRVQWNGMIPWKCGKDTFGSYIYDRYIDKPMFKSKNNEEISFEAKYDSAQAGSALKEIIDRLNEVVSSNVEVKIKPAFKPIKAVFDDKVYVIGADLSPDTDCETLEPGKFDMGATTSTTSNYFINTSNSTASPTATLYYNTDTRATDVWTTNTTTVNPCIIPDTIVNGNITIDSDGYHVGGWNIGDYIQNSNPMKDSNKKGENEKMNMGNLTFGPVNTSKIHLSMYGIAIINKDNRWVSYDAKEGELIDVEVLNFSVKNIIYQMPVAVTEVKEGDVIVHGNVPMFVTRVNMFASAPEGKDKVASFTVIDPWAGEEKTVLPTKNMFNFNFVTKIVSLMDGFGGLKADEAHPFGNMLPFMMMSGDKIDPMMLMLMNGNGEIDQNMLMMLALSNKKDDNNDLLTTMLIMNMMKK